MNIYLVSWEQGGAFGLSAVVIAVNATAAALALELNPDYNENVRVSFLGTAKEGAQQEVVCQESL